MIKYSKKKIFFSVYDANENKKIDTIVLYSVIKKNLEISFQNGLEHETTSLKVRQITYLGFTQKPLLATGFASESD